MVHAFGDYELDTDTLELRALGTPRPVEPQVFEILRYLIEHRDRVVSRDELLRNVWGHEFVAEATVNSRLMAARKAVGDDGRRQDTIRTLRGRGYRFVADVRDGAAPATTALAGRERELTQLADELAAAAGGSRRTVFVTGEPGIGKTALADALLASVPPGTLVGRGWCLDHRGSGEPYMPVLEALGRLCSGPAGAAVLKTLHSRAPTWLLQLPWLLSGRELEAVQTASIGATPERMLRELAEAMEAIAAETPIVLALEDLQWSDDSTLDLVARLAQRTEGARLFVLATCRSEACPALDLQRELAARGHATTVELPLLGRDAVRAQLRALVGEERATEEMADAVHTRTDGNPLFVESLVAHWRTGGGVPRDPPPAAIPASLEDLIVADLRRLAPAELDALGAASVVGRTFHAAAVPADGAEERFTQLARDGRLLEALGPEPFGDVRSARFAFQHDLYREVLYARVPPGRRADIHLRVAGRLRRAEMPAAGIAFHSVQGGDAAGAVEYLRRAAEDAIQRGGAREATRHLREALGQLAAARIDDEERAELDLQILLGPVLAAVEGWGSTGAVDALRRAVELAERIGDDKRLGAALYALAGLMEYRGDYAASEALVARRLGLAARQGDAAAKLESHDLLACSLFHRGRFTEALVHARSGAELFDPAHAHLEVAGVGEHPGASCNNWAALALACTGAFGEAEERARAALAIVDAPPHIHGRAHTLNDAARLHQLRGDPETVAREARAALDLATDQGFAYHAAVARILLGWARAVAGDADGVGLAARGLADHEETGAVMDRPYFAGLYAEALMAHGERAEARRALAGALAMTGSERPFFYEAELHRLMGELELGDGGGLEAAEPHLRAALDVARAQGAETFAARAAAALARGLRAAGRADEADLLTAAG